MERDGDDKPRRQREELERSRRDDEPKRPDAEKSSSFIRDQIRQSEMRPKGTGAETERLPVSPTVQQPKSVEERIQRDLTVAKETDFSTKRILYKNGLDDLLKACAEENGCTPAVLRQASETAIRTRPRDAYIEDEFDAAHGIQPDIHTLHTGIGPVEVIYTNEQHAVVVRGWAWDIGREPVDERDGGYSVPDNAWVVWELDQRERQEGASKAAGDKTGVSPPEEKPRTPKEQPPREEGLARETEQPKQEDREGPKIGEDFAITSTDSAGRVEGTVREHLFKAKVYAEHATNPNWEIGDSRISKLWVMREKDSEVVFEWDRGPQIDAQTKEAKEIVSFLCSTLADETYPPK